MMDEPNVPNDYLRMRQAIPQPMTNFSVTNKEKSDASSNPTAKMIKLATTDIYAARAQQKL
jgi:hypothetical protein